MPDRLEFAPGARGSKGRLKTIITRVDSAGDVVGRSEQFFDSDSHFGVAARFLGVKPVVVMKAFDRYRQKGQAEYPLEEKLDSLPRAPLVFRVRGKTSGKETCSEYADLLQALQ